MIKTSDISPSCSFRCWVFLDRTERDRSKCGLRLSVEAAISRSWEQRHGKVGDRRKADKGHNLKLMFVKTKQNKTKEYHCLFTKITYYRGKMTMGETESKHYRSELLE